MPDHRAHRGAHPADADLFAPLAWPALQEAVAHFSWLLSRSYAAPGALKLVGDRFQLHARQRTAVSRSSCSDQARARRKQHELAPPEIAGQPLAIDGFNLLTTIEAALSGGVVLAGRDGCYRDMASMHGSYRTVQETLPAVELIGRWLDAAGAGPCHWLLDRPVSNSGRLAALMRDVAARHDWPWRVELVPDPDPLLAASENVVISADSEILDRVERWHGLARSLVEVEIPGANIVPMAGEP